MPMTMETRAALSVKPSIKAALSVIVPRVNSAPTDSILQLTNKSVCAVIKTRNLTAKDNVWIKLGLVLWLSLPSL